MKVLLVNPPFLKGFRKFNLNLPPIGLGYIGAMLERHGHEVRILDLSVERWKKGFSGYDAVGITSLTPTYPKARRIAESIREQDPDMPLIIGGPHASFLGEEAFETFDYAVRGEGEYTFLELLEALEEGRSPRGVRGLTYRDDGRILRNPDRPFIEDLDTLPFPARHLFNLRAGGYMKMEGDVVASVVSSRGCPFGCSFCSTSRLTGLRWRARSPGNVGDELEEVGERYGYRSMAFVDDNFSLDPRRVERICDEIMERGLRLKWGCMSRVDTTVKNPRTVRKMAEAGCIRVYMGIESANQAVLESYRKRTNIEMIKKAINILRDNGIGVIGSFILGEIRETREMVERTIKFAKELDPEVAQFSILTPLPGTELWQRVKDKIVKHDLELFDGVHAAMRTEFLEPEELEELLAKAYREFYLRPRRVLRELMYVFKTGDIRELGQIWRFLRARSALF